MNTFYTTPRLAYKLLGTSIALQPGVAYPTVVATNQPEHEKRKAVFLLCDGAGNPDLNGGASVLLERGEYTRLTKYIYLYVLQGSYGYGFEDLCASESRREVVANLRDYRENEGGNYRIIQRRELRGANQ